MWAGKGFPDRSRARLILKRRCIPPVSTFSTGWLTYGDWSVSEHKTSRVNVHINGNLSRREGLGAHHSGPSSRGNADSLIYSSLTSCRSVPLPCLSFWLEKMGPAKRSDRLFTLGLYVRDIFFYRILEHKHTFELSSPNPLEYWLDF